MKKRIFFDIVLLGIIFVCPWWVAMILALVGAFLWSPYYEVIGFGIVFDLLYGALAASFGGVFGLVVSAIIFVLGSVAKNRVR